VLTASHAAWPLVAQESDTGTANYRRAAADDRAPTMLNASGSFKSPDLNAVARYNVQ